MEHVMKEKVSINPKRRKFIRIVGIFRKDENN
jgi:hypothetical protein